MIWQLVKRDPGWRYAVNVAAVAAVAGLIVPREFVGMFAFLIAGCWFSSLPYERATMFQAGLPIRVRDLFLARVLTLLACVWLPVASGAAMLLLSGKPAADAGILVEMGAGFSVLALVAPWAEVPVAAICMSIWA